MKPGDLETLEPPPADSDDRERRFRLLDERLRLLERERQKLSAVVNHTDAGFLSFDARHHVVWTNQAFRSRFWGGRAPAAASDAAPESPIGLPCHRTLCMQDGPCERCPCAAPFASGRVAHHEVRLEVGGRVRHLYATGIPIRSITGEIDESIVMLQDVSDLEVLRQSEARKGAILDTALDAILSFDEHGAITEFNRAAEEMFGYHRCEALGVDVSRLIEAPACASAQSVPGDCRFGLGAREILGRRLETTAARRDGRVFPVEIAIARVPVPGPPMFTAYARDLSERRAAELALRESEDQLRQAQKMEAVGRLAGGIAHDFNNLLTAITGYGEMMLADLREKGPFRAHLREVLKASQRASSLTRQLLAFSRRQILEPKVLDLNSVVAGMFPMLRRLINEDIDLVDRLDGRLPTVKADPGQIEQVIMNLTVNARDAMPHGGTLLLETRSIELDDAYARQHVPLEPGSYAMLAVSDTGSGMSDETMARVFEPFFTTKMHGKGTGLGLATVYGIVKQSGGYIWVYSEEGRGTTFKVYFPRIEEAVAVTGQPAMAPDSLHGSETILLVEDEDLVRALAREVLETHGYTVLDAHIGPEALKIVERHPGSIHMLLTDVVMPQMSGRELAQRVEALRPDVRVLYMSGYTADVIAHEGVLEEGTAYLEKPFTLRALARKVREVLTPPNDAAKDADRGDPAR